MKSGNFTAWLRSLLLSLGCGVLAVGCGSESLPPAGPLPSGGDDAQPSEASPFVDAGLDRAVRQALGLGPGTAMVTATLDCLSVLIASDYAMTDLTGIDRLGSLVTLDISGNRLVEILPLMNLPRLQRLDASNNRIADLQGLASLQWLQVLFLENNAVVDATPLLSLPRLTDVDLSGNPIADVAHLVRLSEQGVDVRLGATKIEPPPCGIPALTRSGTFTVGTPEGLLVFSSGDRCLQFSGSLTIQGTVVDLAALRNLIDIDGTLRFRNTISLLDLKDMSLLQRITSLLWFSSNDSLQSLDGFSSLVSVRGVMVVQANPALTGFGDFPELQTVGELRITSNPLLEQIDGLEGLASVPGTLVLSSNPSMRSLEGLRNLEEIGSGLTIDGNGVLEEMTGFRSLRTVGGTLRIRANPRLRSLAGLDPENIGGSIFILNNPRLRTSEANAFVERMRSKGFDGTVGVNGNAD